MTLCRSSCVDACKDPVHSDQRTFDSSVVCEQTSSMGAAAQVRVEGGEGGLTVYEKKMYG